MDDAYEGGGGCCDGDVVLLEIVAEGGGEVGAMAVCNTGFCTWVLFTDCIIIGGWVLACRAPHASSGVGLATAEVGVVVPPVDTVTGLGLPALAGPEYIPEEGLLR